MYTLQEEDRESPDLNLGNQVSSFSGRLVNTALISVALGTRSNPSLLRMSTRVRLSLW